MSEPRLLVRTRGTARPRPAPTTSSRKTQPVAVHIGPLSETKGLQYRSNMVLLPGESAKQWCAVGSDQVPPTIRCDVSRTGWYSAAVDFGPGAPRLSDALVSCALYVASGTPDGFIAWSRAAPPKADK